MADYPGTLPTFAANGANLSTAPHSSLHTDLNQEVVAIATALGTNPQGTLSTVKARLDKIAPYTGGLTSYTPTVQQSGVVTNTNAYSTWVRIGRLIIGWFNLAVTGTGVASNVIIISAPVAAATLANGATVGTALITDVSLTPDTSFKGLLQVHSTLTDFSIKATATANEDDRLGVASFSAALAAGDIIRGNFIYEAAAD